ncbi:hypothetical protein [Streptomyces europaeiscabiei]|uniref:hypothetical protein n=1 Tax=Streptomyces europaeiscabiei TaxID=146819 RepID=UPI0029AD810B|nr:hypothetical protein [Streptomyces europaeiscabiei]MDX3582963.1 hypothetical protein [Streptomyces europaeiscabiei]
MSGDIDRDAEMLADESHYPEHLRTPPEKVLSANQLVAFNMWRARRGSGWSQQEVAELLEKYTGRSWSNASVSAAERSWQGGRPRKFDANEILALTKIFDEPMVYFFLPPEDSRWNRENVGMREFPDELPNKNPEDKDHDLMSLIPAADYIQSLGMYQLTPAMEFRIAELTLRHLGLSWAPPKWSHPFKHYDPREFSRRRSTTMRPGTDIDVGVPSDASFTMNKEDLYKFLGEVRLRMEQHSAEMARRATEEVEHEILSRLNPPAGEDQE